MTDDTRSDPSLKSHEHNRLLRALPESARERILPLLEPVWFGFRDSLYEAETPIEFVYFPLHGVASLLVVMENGDLVEVGTVGNEGMVGVPVFLGAEMTAGLAFYQIPGDALRMRTDDFRVVIKEGGPFVTILQRYTQALFTMLSQHTGCNRVHGIEQRAARWLLMCQDRVNDYQFPLTQEFLGQMLGVRRAGVNEVMRRFQEAGYLRYQRGVITILDREALEEVSCECYEIVKTEYQRMMDVPLV